MISTARNLRHYQRIITQLEADVFRAGQPVCRTQISNISRSGMMLICDQKTLSTLLPNHNPVAPKLAIRLRAIFELPVLAVQNVELDAQCDVVYVRRQSRDLFEIGVQFVDFSDEGYRYVEQYINYRLKAS